MGLLDRFKSRKPSSEARSAVPPRRVIVEETSPEELFLRHVEALLGARAGVTAVERDPSQPMTLNVTKDGGHSLYLGNIFSETRDKPTSQRDARLERFLCVLDVPGKPRTWEEAQEKLAVALRGPIGLMPRMTGAATPVAREVVPCLREHLVLDEATSISMVTQEDIEKWGQPLDDVFLWGMSLIATNDARLAPHDEDRRIWRVGAGDSYESARLLVPGFISSCADKVKGRPIAIVPSRDTVFIAGDEDPSIVKWMCERALEDYAKSPRRVSAALYTDDENGRLVRYQPIGTDEVSKLVRKCHVEFEGTEHQQQREELEAHYASEGTDLFVAKFSGITTKKGDTYSYCVWAPGVVGLLPRTDLVAVGYDDDKSFFAEWGDVVRVGGTKLQLEPGLFPHRWRTVESLTAAEVTLLRSREFKP